jgi:3-deoxy-D-manno-octulosonate 8-phosphate phosphatase KdsC-like HAD superfamily phosphatase
MWICTVSISRENSQRKNKIVTGTDNFDKNVLRRTALEVYDTDELPATKKLVQEITEAVGYEGSSQSVYRILKATGIKY